MQKKLHVSCVIVFIEKSIMCVGLSMERNIACRCFHGEECKEFSGQMGFTSTAETLVKITESRHWRLKPGWVQVILWSVLVRHTAIASWVASWSFEAPSVSVIPTGLASALPLTGPKNKQIYHSRHQLRSRHCDYIYHLVLINFCITSNLLMSGTGLIWPPGSQHRGW